MSTFKLIGVSPMRVYRPFIRDQRISISLRCLVAGIAAVTGEPLKQRLRLRCSQFTLEDCHVFGDLAILPSGWECEVTTEVDLATLRQVGTSGIGPGRPSYGRFEVVEISE